MEENFGEFKTFNADKEIAQQRDLQLVLNLTRAFTQARTGETPLKSHYAMSNNEKVLNRAKGLSEVIHALKDLVLLGRGRIYDYAFAKWKQKYSKEEEKLQKPFEQDENDFSRLEYIRKKLRACELDIIEADRTPSLEDDFVIEKQTSEGEEWELTDNFFDMLEELENTWTDLELLLLGNKILSQGRIEDELLSYEELAKEAQKRIIES